MQVDKPSGGGDVSKFGGWGPEEPKQERASWRVDDKPAEKRPWGASDRFHAPQQERFVPQGRGRPPNTNDHTPAAKTGDRWRDDGHSRQAAIVFFWLIKVSSKAESWPDLHSGM